MNTDFISKIAPHHYFPVFALVWGFITLLITPPFQVADEPAHFLRAYQVSEGHFMPETENNRVGGYVPVSLISLMTLFSDLPFHPERKTNSDTIIKALNIPLNPDLKTFGFFPNTALYSPISYIPQSVGILTGKIFGLSPLILFYLGRFFNLLVWVIVITLTLKITPIYKWLLMLLALTPMSVFQAASLSADATTNGMAFLFIAMIFRIAFDANKVLTRFDLGMLTILLVFLTLSKYAYCCLMILYFLIPQHKIGSRKKQLLIAAGLFASALTAMAAGSFFVNLIYNSVDPSASYYGVAEGIPQNVKPYQQVLYILTHAGAYLQTLIISIITYFPQLGNSFIGVLGWMDTKLPDIFIVMNYIILLILAIFESNRSVSLHSENKIVLLITFLLLIFSTLTLLYMTWTPVGAPLMNCPQGRYFIPIAPVFLVLFYNNKIVARKEIIRGISMIFPLISLIVMTAALFGRYYF